MTCTDCYPLPFVQKEVLTQLCDRHAAVDTLTQERDAMATDCRMLQDRIERLVGVAAENQRLRVALTDLLSVIDQHRPAYMLGHYQKAKAALRPEGSDG